MASSPITTLLPTTSISPLATVKSDTSERSTVIVSLFLIFYIVVVFMAVVGNLLVLLAVFKNPKMRTVVNIFLANLAGSDLLFAAVSLFDTVAYMQSGWYAGELSCKIQSYIIEVFYTCSILTLVAVSCERYLAICRPHLKSRSIKTTLIVIGIIWSISAGFCSVLLYAYRIRTASKVPICDNLNWSHAQRRVFYTIHSVMVYLVPLSVMVWAHQKISAVIAAHRVPTAEPVQAPQQSEPNINISDGEEKHGERHVEFPNLQENRASTVKRTASKRKTGRHMRGRRKVIKILVTVTVTFFALWTPFVVIRMMMYYNLNVNVYLWKGTQLLILSSTAVNGLIYALMSPQFRRCFKQLLPCFQGDGSFDGTTPSRGRDMNSTSNSVTVAATGTLKSRSLIRGSFRLPKSCL